MIENLGMMSLPGRRATASKETHHDQMIQKAITFAVQVQVSYSILSEVSVPNIQRRDRRICQATDLSSVQAERTGRSLGTECVARACPSDRFDSAEVRGLSLQGLPER